MTGRKLLLLLALTALLIPGSAMWVADQDDTCSESCVDIGQAPEDEGPGLTEAEPTCRNPLPVADGWWNHSWLSRQKLTFNNSAQAEDLVNFPVLVNLSGLNFNFSRANPDGSDLRFIDEDNVTQLKYHIEEWNTTGDSFAWVNVTRIDGGSPTDHMWMYYTNPAAAPVHDVPGTFDEHYLGVWHLNESVKTVGNYNDFRDSTGNGNDGEANIGPGNGVNAPGRMAGAAYFDGDNDNIDCGVPGYNDTGFHTITAWANLDLTSGDTNYELLCYESLFNPFEGIGLYVRRSDGAIGEWLKGVIKYSSVNKVTTGQWAFLAVRGYTNPSSGYIEISLNGGDWENVFSGNTNNLALVGGSPLTIGRWSGGGDSFDTHGTIDEVRISDSLRSIDWIRAQYLSMNNSFISYGEVEYTTGFPYVANPIDDFCMDEDTVDTTIDLSVIFADSDTPSLEFNFSGTQNVAVDIAANGTVTLMPNPDWYGLEQINFNATDGNGTAYEGFNLTVLPVNDPPVITPIADKSVAQGATLFGAALANDERDGEDILFYDNSSLFTIDPVTGLFDLTPANSDVGSYPVSIFVVDENGTAAYANITLNVTNVNDPPSFISIGGKDATGAGTVSGPGTLLSPVILQAVEDYPIKYFVNATDIDESELGMDEGITFKLNLTETMDNILIDPNTGEITFSPLQYDAVAGGGKVYGRVTVQDSGGLTCSAYIVIKVTEINDPPTPPEFNWAVEGDGPGSTDTQRRTVLFTATPSADEDGDQLVYTWVFGDGLKQKDDGGLAVEHKYARYGDFPVILKVSDGRGGRASILHTVVLRDLETLEVIGGGGDDDGDLPIEDINEDPSPEGDDIDSDGDGIPDSWERAHGLDPFDASDADTDPDGDGLSYLEEFLGIKAPSDQGEGAENQTVPDGGDPDPIDGNDPGPADGGDVPEDDDWDGPAREESDNPAGPVLWFLLMLVILCVLSVISVRRSFRKRSEDMWDEMEDESEELTAYAIFVNLDKPAAAFFEVQAPSPPKTPIAMPVTGSSAVPMAVPLSTGSSAVAGLLPSGAPAIPKAVVVAEPDGIGPVTVLRASPLAVKRETNVAIHETPGSPLALFANPRHQ